MQIGEIIHLGKDPGWYLNEVPHSRSHPHTIGLWGDNNTLYLAKEKLDVFGLTNYYGFGKFKASERTNLSIDPSVKKSKWICPKWLNPNHGGCGMTYHKDIKRWGGDTVDIVGRGQEFIAEPKRQTDCKKWLSNIFKDAYIIDEVEYFKKLKEDLNEEVIRRTLLHKDQWTRNTIH